MATLTVNLSSYDYDNSTAVENTSHPFSNAFAGSASTGDYARIDATNNGVTSYYRFDLSALPAGATINSVVVKYKAKINDTSDMFAQTISVVSGTTVKGTAKTLGTTATNDKAFDQITGLSEAEVRTLGVRLYARKETSAWSRYISMYGATLTVDYEPPAPHYIKESDAWRQLSNPTFYKKISGVWVLQSASPFTTTGKYERKNLLPDAYQQVKYLQSDGVAYIITNFTRQPGVTVDMTAQFVSGTGALVGDGSYAGCQAGCYSVTGGYGIDSSTVTGIASTTKASINVVFSSNKTEMTVTTESTSGSCTRPSINHPSSSNWHWCVFATDDSGARTATARIWSVEFSSAFSALLIPCYRKSDNELGFYDVTNNTFYTNAADSGSFIAG